MSLYLHQKFRVWATPLEKNHLVSHINPFPYFYITLLSWMPMIYNIQWKGWWVEHTTLLKRRASEIHPCLHNQVRWKRIRELLSSIDSRFPKSSNQHLLSSLWAADGGTCKDWGDGHSDGVESMTPSSELCLTLERNRLNNCKWRFDFFGLSKLASKMKDCLIFYLSRKVKPEEGT